MKKRAFTRLTILLLCLPAVLIAACSDVRKMTPADRQYIFLPQDIEPVPFADYRPTKAWDDVSYIFFTTYTKRDGFTGVYTTILENPAGKKISFLCNVNIEPTPAQAKHLYTGMVPEHSPREFGRELTIDPAVYHAEQAYLYAADTGYFHLVLRSSRIVYSILLEGASIQERQVRKNLVKKLDYINHNADSIR